MSLRLPGPRLFEAPATFAWLLIVSATLGLARKETNLDRHIASQ